jgi:hypothetical protein
VPPGGPTHPHGVNIAPPLAPPVIWQPCANNDPESMRTPLLPIPLELCPPMISLS